MNVKKKGNEGEDDFSLFLREHGFNARRDGNSGGRLHKSDIVNGLDYSIELKTVNKLNLQEAWRQVSRDSSLARNAPLVAVHFDEMPQKEWIICIHSNDWIELEKLARQGTPSAPKQSSNIIQNQRELAYVLNMLKVALNKAIKLLE